MAAGDTNQTIPVQITYAFVLCSITKIEHVQFQFTLNLCRRTTRHEQNMCSFKCTGVVLLGSPAVITLCLCHAKEAICQFTAWYTLIPVRILLVSYMVCIN